MNNTIAPSSDPYFDINELLKQKISPASITNNLIVHNWNSTIFQLFELQVPYMVSIENCHKSSNDFHIHQLSPVENMKGYFKISDYLEYSKRPLHQHNCFEVMLVLSGNVSHHIENHFFTCSPGQCCIMNRNVNHCEEFTNDFQAVFFLLKEDFVSQMMKRDIYFSPDGSCKSREGNIYQLFKENSVHQKYYEKVYLDFTPVVSANHILDLLIPLLNQIVAETTLQKPGYFCMVQGLFARLFSILEDPSLFYFTRIQTNSGTQELLFTKLTQILEASHGRISRKELESLLNYNSEYLNRIVKKHAGMNLTEFGKTFYLADAKRMLLETDKSISEIISELGFANRNHFYRIFEKKYGVTPNEYRKMNAADPE